MKAAVCHTFGQDLVIEEIALAEPVTDELQVDIKACAICHSDIIFMDGAWGGDLPAVYGHEAAGVVSKLGPNVRGLKVGDPVVVTLIRSCGDCHYCAQGVQTQCDGDLEANQRAILTKGDQAVVQGMATGAFAEKVTVHKSQVVRIPNDMSMAAASLLACGVITGYGAVSKTVDMPAGATCAVVGCGGVGLNAVQAAAHQGASKIIAIDVEDSKLEVAKDFGATHGMNARSNDLAEQIKEATNGRGADFVFVTVGIAKVMDQAHSFLAKAGTVVLVGMPGNGEETRFDAATFSAYGQKVVGSKMGSAQIAKDIPALIDLYQAGRLKLDELVTKTYAFEDINQAISDSRRGDSLRNVLMFDD